jgi:hypothetical protein
LKSVAKILGEEFHEILFVVLSFQVPNMNMNMKKAVGL